MVIFTYYHGPSYYFWSEDMDKPSARLEGKVALVTGAGSGIGRAVALRFAREGARVALVGRTASSLEDTAAEIRGLGGEAIALVADVAIEHDADAAVQRALAAFGALHVAVNSAGTLGKLAPIVDMEADEFDAVVGTNLRGVWLMARAQVRAMLAAGAGGAIVNISSFVAQAPNAGSSAYAASKAGVDAMTRVLALEAGSHGIRINSLAPGVTTTPMFEGSGVPGELRQSLARHAPLGRLGTPDDIAGAAAWIVSEDAGFVTGQTILVDGGFAIPGLR